MWRRGVLVWPVFLVSICCCVVHARAHAPKGPTHDTTRQSVLRELAAHRMTTHWRMADNPGHVVIHFSKQYWPLNVLVEIANSTTLGCGGTVVVEDYTCPYTDMEWAQGKWETDMICYGDACSRETSWSLERPTDWVFPKSHHQDTFGAISRPTTISPPPPPPPPRYPDYYRVTIHIDFDANCGNDDKGNKDEKNV